MTEIPEDLRQRLRQFGQEHVLSQWSALSDERRTGLLAQLQSLDLKLLHQLYLQKDEPMHLPRVDAIRPIQAVKVGSEDLAARRTGEEMIRRGEVAILVVAGGQGTRLGADQPKGTFPVGPVSNKSLFQLHAEKVLALRERFGAQLPLLVMTSAATDSKTREFFEANRYFGLPPADVHFFSQGNMPALELATGKLLLAGPDRLSMSPNGHGGTLTALRDSGLLAKLQQWGTRAVYYFQVDNPLVRIAEPAFLGHHRERRAEVSLKVIPKLGPTDKLGNTVEVDGRCQIIEYSDLPPELAESRDENGALRFALGSPAIHVFDVDFLVRVLRDHTSLPFHLARKKVPHVNERGERMEPKEPNALKFEMFIFDVLPLAERWSVVETSREEEFAPLKNDTGPDSPETVRQAISDLAWRWLGEAGVQVPEARPPVEISPQFALDAEELKAKFGPGLIIKGPTLLE